MGTKWHFNPLYAPHMGGSWERMIGLTKKILPQTLPQYVHPRDPESITPNRLLKLKCTIGPTIPGSWRFRRRRIRTKNVAYSSKPSGSILEQICTRKSVVDVGVLVIGENRAVNFNICCKIATTLYNHCLIAIFGFLCQIIILTN